MCLTKLSILNIIKLNLHQVDYNILEVSIAFESLRSLFYAKPL